MDLPLSARVLTEPPNPTAGGGIVTFYGATAAELKREADRVLGDYGDATFVPTTGTPPTPATMIRGMTLAASSSGTQYVCELQIEPDETEIALPTFPIDQQCPINALQGQYDTVGFSALQFVELADIRELDRQLRPQTFRAAELAAHGVASATHELVYEVALAGPFNHVYVAAVLWSFQDVTLV